MGKYYYIYTHLFHTNLHAYGKNIKIRLKLGTRGKFGFTLGPVLKTMIVGIVIKLVMLLLLYIFFRIYNKF